MLIGLNIYDGKKYLPNHNNARLEVRFITEIVVKATKTQSFGRERAEAGG